jgi:hypothetical protein
MGRRPFKSYVAAGNAFAVLDVSEKVARALSAIAHDLVPLTRFHHRFLSSSAPSLKPYAAHGRGPLAASCLAAGQGFYMPSIFALRSALLIGNAGNSGRLFGMPV